MRAGLRWGALVVALGCDAQEMHLFSPVRVITDAGATPETKEPPEQPLCASAQCLSCTAVPDGCDVNGSRWLCHPWTGECALPCDPTSRSSQCPPQQSCHPDHGLCVSCLDAGDCAGSTPACDEQQNTCVECTSDASCGLDLPVCDTAAQRCVACTEARHCAAGQVCDTRVPACVQCLVNDDCVDQPGDDDRRICDLSSNLCVECLSNTDCTAEPDKPFCKLSELECDDDTEE